MAQADAQCEPGEDRVQERIEGMWPENLVTNTMM